MESLDETSFVPRFPGRFRKLAESLILHIRNLIHSPEFQEGHRASSSSFTQGDGPLTFPTLILILLNQMKNPLQVELDTFFQTLKQAGLTGDGVSKSAFSQARLKVKDSAFRELQNRLVNFLDAQFPLARWKGHRVLTLDSFTLRLPRSPEVREAFHAGRDAAPHVPLGLGTILYDVLNRLPLHASLHPSPADERVLALEHGPFLMPGDLVLMDRGFPAFWFLVWLREQGAHFCTRVTGST